jgi:hypothetical protein
VIGPDGLPPERMALGRECCFMAWIPSWSGVGQLSDSVP